MAAHLVIDSHAVDDVVVVTAAGELEASTSGRLVTVAERAMHRPECHTLHLDLSGVTFCDSTGLGAIVTIRNGCKPLGIALVLDKPSERVTRLINITGLDQVFAVTR